MIDILGTLSAVYGLWKDLVSPRSRRTKLRRAYALMEQWFDEIDRNLDSELNLALLDNLAGKVSTYLKDHDLEYFRINPTLQQRREFLKARGIRADLRDHPELFQNYADISVEGVYLKHWWEATVIAFDRFAAQAPDSSIGIVENRLKFLRFYLKVKAE